MTDTVSLGEWAIKYLDYSKIEHSNRTYKEEKVPAFKRLFALTKLQKEDAVEKLSPAISLVHIMNLAKEKTGSTANTDRKNLQAAWNWGVKYLEMPRINPFNLVEKQKQNKRPRYVPTLSDFWKVYNVAYCEQDRRLLLCYLHTAARRDELFRLRWTDINFFSKKIQLWSRKNKLGEWVGDWLPMTSDLEKAFREQYVLSGSGKFVFTDEKSGLPFLHRNHFMKRLCGFANVKYFDFHAIRHLSASTLAGLGVPIINIQLILRHKLISTTDRYIRSLKQEGREAVEMLPGPKTNHSQNHSQAPGRDVVSSPK